MSMNAETKIKILSAIAIKPKSIRQLAKETGISKMMLWKHIRILRDNGEIERDHYGWPTSAGGKECFYRVV